MGKSKASLVPYQFHILDTNKSFIVFGLDVATEFADKLYSMGFKKYWFTGMDEWELTKWLITREN